MVGEASHQGFISVNVQDEEEGLVLIIADPDSQVPDSERGNNFIVTGFSDTSPARDVYDYGEPPIKVISSEWNYKVKIPTRVDLRDDSIEDDHDIMIHMGEGDASKIVRNIIQNAIDYRETSVYKDKFCLSVFRVTDEVTQDNITDANLQNTFGYAKYGDIQHLIRDVLPTSSYYEGADAKMLHIQREHFDFVLDCDMLPTVSTKDPDTVNDVLDALWPIMDVYGPTRVNKHTGKKFEATHDDRKQISD